MIEVFQVDDRYSGPVLGGRYQVMASAIGGTFYIYDHDARDSIRRNDDTMRFATIDEASQYLGFTRDGEKFIGPDPVISTAGKQESKMARSPKANGAAVKAAVKMDKAIDAPKTVKASKKAAAVPAGAAGAVAPAEPKRGRSKSTAGTLASAIREMIAKAGKKTDDQLLADARAAFPEKKIPANAISYYRERM